MNTAPTAASALCCPRTPQSRIQVAQGPRICPGKVQKPRDRHVERGDERHLARSGGRLVLHFERSPDACVSSGSAPVRKCHFSPSSASEVTQIPADSLHPSSSQSVEFRAPAGSERPTQISRAKHQVNRAVPDHWRVPSGRLRRRAKRVEIRGVREEQGTYQRQALHSRRIRPAPQRPRSRSDFANSLRLDAHELNLAAVCAASV